jgi:hypothetical protein
MNFSVELAFWKKEGGVNNRHGNSGKGLTMGSILTAVGKQTTVAG